MAVTPKHLQGLLQYINELGMSAYSQARILSGIKGFFKYLMFEELIEKDPTELIEGPKIGRKLPDTLSYPEIEKLLETIDLSTPEGGRNRAVFANSPIGRHQPNAGGRPHRHDDQRELCGGYRGRGERTKRRHDCRYR